MKRCSKCGEEKPATVEYFNLRKDVHGGFRAMCKQCITKQSRAWHEANRERKKIANRVWYTGNTERVAEYNRTHQDAKRKSKASAQRARAARKRNAEGHHTAEDVRAQHKAQKGKCYYCKSSVGDKYHVDHVVPLSRGGANGPENLVIACGTCNMSKRDKLPHEWAQGGRLL